MSIYVSHTQCFIVSWLSQTHLGTLCSGAAWPVLSMLCLAYCCPDWAVKAKALPQVYFHTDTGDTLDLVLSIVLLTGWRVQREMGNKASLISGPLCCIPRRKMFNSSSELPHPPVSLSSFFSPCSISLRFEIFVNVCVF